MKTKTKVAIIVLSIIASIVVALHIASVSSSILVGIVNVLASKDRYYSTTNLEDYGKYAGNTDNGKVGELINSFFPDEIKDSFSDVTYSYRAECYDTYGYEAYLEFVIEDKGEYLDFVSRYTHGIESKTFKYDSSFIEYSINNQVRLTAYYDEETGDYPMENVNFEYADIRKILCSDEEQRIIFVSIGVHDGGAATADYLCVFFDRFSIDLLEYTENVSYGK